MKISLWSKSGSSQTHEIVSQNVLGKKYVGDMPVLHVRVERRYDALKLNIEISKEELENLLIECNKG